MALYIGLMSGTSMDGIDAALVELPENKLLYGITKQYSDEVKSLLTTLMNERSVELASLCQLNTLIGRDFAHAVHELLDESGYSAVAIDAIGSHGQTVCHDANAKIPYTLQLGCGHTIASLTGIDVVADFRTRDMVHGGQGAPFAPRYHHELFSQPNECVAIVNIGGIANITVLDPEIGVKGWDVGPGNCLMDSWIYRHQGMRYDERGNWASQGVVIDTLLQQLLTDPFVSQLPPKSIGKEYFSLSWLDAQYCKDYKPEDIQATLVALTASCIAKSILMAHNNIAKVYVCGGGVHNIQLMNKLRDYLPKQVVDNVAVLGAHPDYIEAMMFAWFASQATQQIPVDLREITGAQCSSVLGVIYPKSI